MSVGRGGGCCRQANTQAPSGPKRLKRFLVFIEQPRFDDPVVLDPQEEEIRLLEDAIPPLPDCGGQCRGMHVAREDVDELRPKRPAAQLGELLEISKNRLVSAVISRDFGRTFSKSPSSFPLGSLKTTHGPGGTSNERPSDFHPRARSSLAFALRSFTSKSGRMEGAGRWSASKYCVPSQTRRAATFAPNACWFQTTFAPKTFV